MLRGLGRWLNSLGAGGESAGEVPVEVAAAALLLESAAADDELHAFEQAAIAQVLAGHFSLDAAGVEAVIARAEQARREAIDLHGFTTVLVRNHDERRRLALVEALWRVVLADGQLTAHEGILARKLGNLLDLRPEDVSIAIRRARGERLPWPGA
ncbi:MAG: TerB family tellurite resistance protein [Candidatus Eisenbacteria bacterium]|nr:TerB family tellurite resistance protein [Candidatus Eisenbacteria bacterium]